MAFIICLSAGSQILGYNKGKVQTAFFTLIMPSASVEDLSIPGTKSICRESSTSFLVANSGAGYTYQWQVNKGAGYTNLAVDSVYSTVNSRIIYINKAPGNYYGFKYRCLSNNSVNTIISGEFVLTFVSTWTGADGESWNNPDNWSCGVVPDEFTDIIVNSITRSPVIRINASCHSLTLNPGAIIAIAPNVNLTITGIY